MIYQVGPLEIETGKHPKIKTFLSATEDEIREHGFDSDFFYKENDVSSLIKDGKLADNPPYFTMYQDGDRYDTGFAYDLEKKEINLTVRSDVLNTNSEHAWEDVDYYPIYSFFHFNGEAGNLFQNLSDVEDAIEMAKSVNEYLIHDLCITVTKPSELYHVTIQSLEQSGIQWCADDEIKVERDIRAKDMKEFLPQLRETELDFVKQESEQIKALEEEYRER